MKTGVRGTTTVDAAYFYAPYIPLMKKPKYSFSRAKWYVAEFDLKDYDEVRQWCSTQFGKHDGCTDAWSRWWHRYETSIHFRDQKDYVLFMLRWS